MPWARALGGRNVRNRRAGFAHAENGLNLADTSVMNLVIMLTTVNWANLVCTKRSIQPLGRRAPFKGSPAKVSRHVLRISRKMP